MLDVLTPTPQFIIPMIVPYGGEMMDAMGFNVFPKSSIEYFEKFCRQILRHVLFLVEFGSIQFEFLIIDIFYGLQCTLNFTP